MTVAETSARVEELKPVAAFASRVPPSRGKRTDPSTLVRWILKGCRMADGTRLKLKATRLGARWMVSEAAWAEFVAALTGSYVADQARHGDATGPAARSRAGEAAAAELVEMGA